MTERSEAAADRRILTLPAVHPCEASSPAALLHSITALCRRLVAFRSHRFVSHRRTTREAVRQAGILLSFFDDLRVGNAALPGSVTVAFSELHVTLQRIHHLLHDCARRDARLFILMMSDRVTCEFRHLIRTVATALDVLPLASIEASPDIIELVRLVSKQAWEVVIDSDPADGRAVKEIQLILNQFKNGAPPAPADLKKVLDHLQIIRWSECNDEVLFLEEEYFAAKNGDNCEAGVLASLIGFMAYCRATMFHAVDVRPSEQQQKQQNSPQQLALIRLNSEDLRCPISLEIMKEPVTISTGHTYDRPSIEKWLKAGCQTCPVTGERLTKTELVPNTTLKKLVDDFCHQNNIPLPAAEASNHHKKRDLTKTLLPGSSAAAGAARMLGDFLVDQLSTGTTEDKNKAAYEIRLLSKSSLFNRASLVEAGSVPWLLHLLYSADPSTQENAVAALLNLSKHPKGRAAIHESGGLALVIDVIREGLKVEAQQNAAAIMFYLSSVEKFRQEIGEIPEAIPTLVDLLRRGAYRGKKNAVVSLFGLQLFPPNHAKVLSAGAIPVIADLLSTERGDLVNDCIAVLAKVAERQEGSIAILRSSAVPKLVEVLHSSTSRSGREYCVSVLLSLCINGGEKAVRLLEKVPLLMPSLYSLVTDGSPQACKKARSVLNHIHRLHEQDYPAVLTSPVHDRIIHAQ